MSQDLNMYALLALIPALLGVGSPLMAAGESEAIPVVKVARSMSFLETDAARWMSFGLVLGGSSLLLGLILSRARSLSLTVAISHCLFVLSGMGILSFALFADGSRGTSDPNPMGFVALIRLQLVLSSVMIFNFLEKTDRKQEIGTIFSAIVGAVLGATMLDFIYPIDSFVLLTEVILIGASLFLGGREYYEGSSRILFFHLLIVLGMSYLALWLPDLKRLNAQASGYPLLAAIQLSMSALIASSQWTSLTEAHTDKFARLKREIYASEVRLQKQAQMIQLLQTDCQILEAKLQEETQVHYQVELQDNLKIKALEEMGQDIAQGMIAYLKELDYDSHQIMIECKSPKARLHRIRAFAERSSQLASKVRDVMGFLQRDNVGDEKQKVNASDLLKECLRICHEKITRNGVELEIESYEKDLWLEGRLTLLAQGFLGLLYNALEATETSDVRRVTIRLRRVSIEGEMWIELGVSNSGTGIPTGIKAKVFHGKSRDGLGSHSLGLSMAFGVFESFGGTLTLDNDAVATTFVARLPLFRKGEDSGLRAAI